MPPAVRAALGEGRRPPRPSGSLSDVSAESSTLTTTWNHEHLLDNRRAFESSWELSAQEMAALDHQTGALAGDWTVGVPPKKGDLPWLYFGC